MAKVSHSSDLCVCRNCGEPLDVFVPRARQFCCEDCEQSFRGPYDPGERGAMPWCERCKCYHHATAECIT